MEQERDLVEQLRETKERLDELKNQTALTQLQSPRGRTEIISSAGVNAGCLMKQIKIDTYIKNVITEFEFRGRKYMITVMPRCVKQKGHKKCLEKGVYTDKCYADYGTLVECVYPYERFDEIFPLAENTGERRE